MQTIISTYLQKAFSDLQTNLANNIPNNCQLNNFNFTNNTPNYNIPINYQFYILKYFPAYLAEYNYLYKKLNYYNFFSFNKNLNVLSLGCGCGIDLLSFYLYRGILDFNYTGIDLSNWNYRNLILQPSPKINFIQADLTTFDYSQLNDINIIFFPKSIGEIPPIPFQNFLNNFSKINFSSNRIAVILSAINPYDDFNKYKNVINIIKQSGYDFIINDNKHRTINGMYHIDTDNFKGINTVVQEFNYPQNILSNLNNLKSNCSNCNPVSQNGCALNQNPILTTYNWHFTFDILEKI